MTDSIGVAVIGAGMAGRSHAHAYRTAQTVFGTDAPPVGLVAIADINADFAHHTRDRAEATLKKHDVDAAMRVELAYPGGIPGRLHWDMNAEGRQMVWTVTGTAATAVVPAFTVPHLDNRIVITRNGSTEEQTLGDQTSYNYQLAALAETLRSGAEFLIDVDDSVANAELIDEVYRRAGLTPRG